MNFLIIVVIVLLVHQGQWVPLIQKDQWFFCILDRVSGKTRSGIFLILVMAAPVVLLVLLIASVAEHRSLLFLINVLVLLYAIGRDSWQQACNRWVDLFNEADPAILKQKLAESDSADESNCSDAEIENIWQQARGQVLYQQLSGFYAVVFLFFLLGAPAALFYRLLQLYQQHCDQNEQISLVDFRKVLWLLEWLPVRLMALLFCLVGHFATSFWVLQQIMRDSFTPSVDVLTRCADAALFVETDGGDFEKEGEISQDERNRKRMERVTAKSLEKKTLVVMRGYCRQLQRLLRHVEVAFLALLAVITLL